MKKTLLSFYLLLIVSILVAQSVRIVPTKRVEQRNGKQYFIHIVEKGQTVYSIAKAYNVGIDEIYYENPSSKMGININQELLVPTTNKETEIRQEIKDADFDFFYHVCAENETFADVAGIYLISADKIRNANPMARPPFREGQYLKIPVEIPESVIKAEFPPEAVATRNKAQKDFTRKVTNTVSFNPTLAVIPDYRHVVIAGETTQGIADKYQVDIKKLKAVNPGLGDRVERGERLRIPADGVIGGKPSSATILSGIAATPKKRNPEVEEPIGEPAKSAASKQVPDGGQYVVHTVKKKENLYRISRNYGVSIQDLYDANPGLTERLRIGQQIKVPKKKIINNFIIHDVGSKTKVRKIAKLYGIPESAIKKINRGIGKYAYRGQEVKIPVGRNAIVVSKSNPISEAGKKYEEGKKEVGPGLGNSCPKHAYDAKRVIRIALMVPLYLEQMTDSVAVDKVLRGNASAFKSFKFVNFVEGAQLAVDSLRSQGLNIELKVYDVDKNLKKTTKVLQDPRLKDMDLIIGPFYSQSFNLVALFAGNFGIPIVNPLTYRKSVLQDYKTVIKVKPDEETQLGLISSLISQRYQKSKLFLITQNSYRDAEKIIGLENTLGQIPLPDIAYSNSELYNYSVLVAMRDEEWVEGNWMPDVVIEGKQLQPSYLKENIDDSTSFGNSLVKINYMSEGFDKFMNNASALRPNTVVLYGRDKAFVMDVMNRLNEFRDSLNINVIGLPLWEKFENIDLVQTNNLNTIVPESEYIDYESEAVQDFIHAFRQSYSTDPGEYGFAAYDITWFFVNAIRYFGDGFVDCLPYFREPGLSGNMNFGKAFIGNSSFVNLNWNLIMYHNLRKNLIYLEKPSFSDENLQ
ncbi:MAG: LysM peptidoglycan-binding domain-containing protein [Chlorobi bacterium]|nr:LysM peptidoglycan-binding domain-containing protein [Chlorobiota bacterium]